MRNKFFTFLERVNFARWILLFNLLTLLLIIVISIFVYKSDAIMFSAIDLFDEKTQKALNLGEKRNKLMKFIEEFDLFSSKVFNVGNSIGLPILDIKLDQKNIDYINGVIARSLDQSKNVYSLGPFVSIYDNEFVKQTETKILFEGKEYDAKIKLHGVAEDNFKNPKKSYSIKTSKLALIDNVRRFKLIIFEEQFIQTLFAYYISSFMDYLDVEADIVQARFNGIDQGFYLFEEALSKEMLEKNNLAGVDLIKAHDEWTHQYLTGHLTLFTHELANQDLRNYSGKDVGQLFLFKKLMDAKDYKEIESLVDLDRFAKHEAMRILFGTDQSITGDNLRLLFDTTSGKFFPYFRMEGYLLPLPYSDLSKTFDKELNDWFGYDYKIKIFPILNRNKEFRALRNKHLYKLLSSRDELEQYYLELFNKYSTLVGKDRTNNYPARWYLYKMKSSLSALSSNFDYIEKYLNYSKVFTSLYQLSDREYMIEIIPDSNSPVKINSIQLGEINSSMPLQIRDSLSKEGTYTNTSLKDFFSDKYFSLSLDESLEIEKSIYRYFIRFEDIENIENFNVSFVNSITAKPVPEKETYIKRIVIPKKLELDVEPHDVNNSYSHDVINSHISKYPGLIKEEGRITFTKGNYEIKEDLIFPDSLEVKIDKGVVLTLYPGVSILVKGNFFINGTETEPIKIFNQVEGQPFGTVAAVGNRNKTKVNISHLDIKGGSEDIVSGAYLSGALSLYHHYEVNISNSFIHGNFADDGLNIKNAKVSLLQNKFSDNFADQVDLDYCYGEVRNNIFQYKESPILDVPLALEVNGDGLDMSGSELIVKDNSFLYFLDKAISVGERTNTFLSYNKFEKNRSAVTLKDESKGFLFSNTYLDNSLNIEMFQKKPIFKHPMAYNFNEQHPNSKILKTPSSHYYKASDVPSDINGLALLVQNKINSRFLDKTTFSWIEYE